jgi:hypothetical protein
LAVGATPQCGTNCHCCVGLGCCGEYVEQPEGIRPALERAQKKVDDGMVALVNVT